MQYNQFREEVFTFQHAHAANIAEDAIREAGEAYGNSIRRGECIMSSSILDEHFNALETQIKNERRFHEDCFTSSGGVKFKIISRNKLSDDKKFVRFLKGAGNGTDEEAQDINIMLRVQDQQNRIWFLIPTARAWGQIRKALSFPKSLFDNLAKAGNFHLLVEILTFLLNNMEEQNFLLRMIGFDEQRGKTIQCGEKTPYLLRAFLPSKFCRMDNIYLCNAVKTGIEKLRKDVANIHFSLEKDGGDMLIDIEFAEMKELRARKLDEEYVSGIRIKSSEIGSYDHITVQVMLKRLICLNGMTVDKTGGATYISYYQSAIDAGMERFQNLPEFPMPEKFAAQQEQIEKLIFTIISDCCGDMDKLLETFVGRLNRLLAEAEADGEKFNSDEDIKAAIKYILYRAGLLVIRGVSVERVFEYYRQERAADSSLPIAWLLINAITRYATHYMMRHNLDNAQIIQSRIYSHVLNPAHMTWRNISQFVKDQREKANNKVRGVKV